MIKVSQNTALFIFNDSADRHMKNDASRIFSVLKLCLSVFAVLSTENFTESIFGQRIDAIIGNKGNIASLTAVSAVRSAVHNRFFMSESDGSIAAFSRNYCNFHFIMHSLLPPDTEE